MVLLLQMVSEHFSPNGVGVHLLKVPDVPSHLPFQKDQVQLPASSRQGSEGCLVRGERQRRDRFQLIKIIASNFLFTGS